MRKKAHKYRTGCLTEEEISDVMRWLPALKAHHQLILNLALLKGWRECEITGVTIGEMQNAEGKLIFSFQSDSAKKQSKIPLRTNKKINDSIRFLHGVARKSQPIVEIKKNSCYRFWYRLQIKMWGKVRYDFHSLRRTAICKYYEKTGNLDKTRLFARHKDNFVTQWYLLAGSKEVKKVVVVKDRSVKTRFRGSWIITFEDDFKIVLERDEVL